MRRVLITGSREWPKVYQRIVSVTLLAELDYVRRMSMALTIVHGACPTGVDKFADEWCYMNRESVEIERHPADWNLLGKSAGFKRNEHMVSLGADKCLAFIFNKSRGASHCADKAEAAGIKVIRFRIDVRSS